MAAFTTHAVAQIEGLGALFGGNIQRVARQTFGRFLGLADAQVAPYALADGPVSAL